MPSIEISRKDTPDALLPEGFTFALQARLENGQELIAHQHHGPIVIEFIEDLDSAEAVVCVERLAADVDGAWAEKYDVRSRASS
jgi:hypothetical protein